MHKLKLKSKIIIISLLVLILSYIILFLIYFIDNIKNENKTYEYRIELKYNSIYDDYKKYSNSFLSFNQFLKQNKHLNIEKEKNIINFSNKYNIKVIDKGYNIQTFIKAFLTKKQKEKIKKDENILSLNKEIYRKKLDTKNSSQIFGNTKTGIIKYKENQNTNDIAPLVSVIDTGIEVDHIAFLKMPDIPVKINSQADLDNLVGLNIYRPKFINKKIPLSYNYFKKRNTRNTKLDHGLHVSGIIGGNAEVDDLEFKGVEPNAQIISLNVFSSQGVAGDSQTIKAIEDSIILGADIINMSLGVPTGELDLEDNYHSYGFTKALKAAYEAKIHIVSAVGNSGKQKIIENQNSSHKDYVDQQTLYNPATSKYSFSVGSCDKNYTKISSFSSVGTTQDLEIKPDIIAPGEDIYSLAFDSGLKYESGTSMSSPNTAGAIAKSLKTFKDLNIDFDYQQALLMSRTGLLRDKNDTPYSPRYQGAGYIRLENLEEPLGYFYNPDKKNRAKFNLKKDLNNPNIYNLDINFKSLKTNTYILSSSLQTILYDENEKIKTDEFKKLTSKVKYYIDDIEYNQYTFIKDKDYKISIKIILNENDLNYLNTFKYGTFLEGFIIFKDKNKELDNNLDKNYKQDNYIHAPFIGFTKDYNKQPIFTSTTLNDNLYQNLVDISYYQPNIILENQKLNKYFQLGSISNINDLDIKLAYNNLSKSNNFLDKKTKAYIDDLSNHYVLDDLNNNTYQIKSIYFPVYKNIKKLPIIDFYNNNIDTNKIFQIDPYNIKNSEFFIENEEKIINARYKFSHLDIINNQKGFDLEKAASYNLINNYNKNFDYNFDKKIIMRFNASLEKSFKNLDVFQDFEILIDKKDPKITNISKTKNSIKINYEEDTIPLGFLIYKNNKKVFKFLDNFNKNTDININKTYEIFEDIDNIKAIQVFDFLGKKSKIISINNKDITENLNKVYKKYINVYVKQANNYVKHKTIEYLSNQDKNEIFTNYLKTLENIAKENFKNIVIYKDENESEKFIKDKDVVTNNNYYIDFIDPTFNFYLIPKEERQSEEELKNDYIYYKFYDYFKKNKEKLILNNVSLDYLYTYFLNIDKNIEIFKHYKSLKFYSQRLSSNVSYNNLLDILKDLYKQKDADVYKPISITIKPIMEKKRYKLIDPLKNISVSITYTTTYNDLEIDKNNFIGIYYNGEKVNKIKDLLNNLIDNKIYIDFRYQNKETKYNKNINFYYIHENQAILYNTIYLNINDKNKIVKEYIEKDINIINNLKNRVYFFDKSLKNIYDYKKDNINNLNYYFISQNNNIKNVNIYKINLDNTHTFIDSIIVNIDTKIKQVNDYILENIENNLKNNIKRVYYFNKQDSVYSLENDNIYHKNYYYKDYIDIKFIKNNNIIDTKRFLLEEKQEKLDNLIIENKKTEKQKGYILNYYLDEDLNTLYQKNIDQLTNNTYYLKLEKVNFLINETKQPFDFDIDFFSIKHYEIKKVLIKKENDEKGIILNKNEVISYIHNTYFNEDITTFKLIIIEKTPIIYSLIDSNTNNILKFSIESDFNLLKFKKSNYTFMYFLHNGNIVKNIDYLLNNLENKNIIVSSVFSENQKFEIIIYENDNLIDKFDIYKNTYLEKLKNYYKKGYNFINYYKEKENINIFTLPYKVINNTKIYLKYAPKTYKFSFNIEDINFNYNFEYNKYYELKQIKGFKITYKSNDLIIPDKGIWIYDINNLTYEKEIIFYNLNIDYGNINTYENIYNKEEIYAFTIKTSDFIIKKPIKTGYEFLGYIENENDIPKKEYIIKKGSSKDINLKAIFKEINYNIDYIIDKNALLDFNNLKKSYTINDEFYLPQPKLKGYKFTYWTYVLNGVEKQIKKIEKGTFKNLVIKANFIKDKNTNLSLFIFIFVGLICFLVSIFIIIIIYIIKIKRKNI